MCPEVAKQMCHLSAELRSSSRPLRQGPVTPQRAPRRPPPGCWTWERCLHLCTGERHRELPPASVLSPQLRHPSCLCRGERMGGGTVNALVFSPLSLETPITFLCRLRLAGVSLGNRAVLPSGTQGPETQDRQCPLNNCWPKSGRG